MGTQNHLRRTTLIHVRTVANVRIMFGKNQPCVTNPLNNVLAGGHSNCTVIKQAEAVV